MLTLSTHYRVEEEELRYKLYWQDRFLTAYNTGYPKYGDFHKAKPDLSPVYTLSGREVTTTGAYRYNHHRSIWLGHNRVNGVNFFHDNNPERAPLGDIILEEGEVSVSDDGILLTTRNAWTPRESKPLLLEARTIALQLWEGEPSARAYTIDITATLESQVAVVDFADDFHSFIGVRVADTMDEEDGGRILNSEGQLGEGETRSQPARWVDYQGPVAGRLCGVTLMTHPDNPPSRYFTRAYGTFLSSFTIGREHRLTQGDPLTVGYRILVHEGDVGAETIDRVYHAWIG